MTEYVIIGVFALTGILFAGAAMVASRILAPRFPNQGKKLEAYESGEDAIGSARIQFKVGYYLFALVFLVFDVEAVFLFPVLSVLRESGEGAIPGVGADPATTTVRVTVMTLRKKLGDPPVLHTVVGSGYRVAGG